MGIAKHVAKAGAKKQVNKALDSTGKVGDVIDKHTSTGPLDKLDDSVDKAKDDVKRKKKGK